MKKKTVYLFSGIIFFFTSCNNVLIDKGPVEISVPKDISRSKELGLFIKEFNPKNIEINDTLHFEILSAWIEYNFYTSDIEEKYMEKNNWAEGKEWELKKGFNPINHGHLSFLIKGDFQKKYPTYNDGWDFSYCQLIETSDTSISNNYTYFETYGPVSYDSSTTNIQIQLEYYKPSEDTTKYGQWIKFGTLNLTEKNYIDTCCKK